MDTRYFAAAVAVVAVGIGGLQLFGGTRYTIAPGAITGDASSGLSGTFRITEHRPIEVKAAYPYITLWLGIPSQRTGGACLVAQPEDLGPDYAPMINSNCHSNSECFRDVKDANDQYTREYGYCDVPSRTCWARPGPGIKGKPASAPYCNRSIDYDPQPYWEAGKDHPANRAPLKTPLPASGKSIRYRVVACLHQINPDTGLDSGDCGKVDGKLRKEILGPIREVTGR